MNDAVLIQHVYGDTPDYYNLFKVTAVRNVEYCQNHKMDYEMIANGAIDRANGDWAKLYMVRAAMNSPYKYIIWLDPDTIIVDLAADLRDGCPPNGIGACRHVIYQNGMTIDHFNVGALYISNCEKTRAFMDKWLAGYPGTTEPAWWEQGVMNNINDGTVVEIDAKYNATGKVNPSPTPVVLGFHGQGDVRMRFNAMCAAIGK